MLACPIMSVNALDDILYDFTIHFLHPLFLCIFFVRVINYIKIRGAEAPGMFKPNPSVYIF